jgi:hypothetical protein
LLGNPHLPTEIKNSIREKKGIFRAQLLQNGLYLCTEAVSPDGHISLRSQSLKPLVQPSGSFDSAFGKEI